MTSETPNLHVSKNLNISKTKQDIEKLKMLLRLVWKCCSVVFKIGAKIFSLQWHFIKQYMHFLYNQLGLNFRFKNNVIKMCHNDVQNLKSEIHHRFNWSAQLVSCTDFDYMHDHHNTF